MYPSSLITKCGYLLPSSTSLRAAEFERLCRVVLSMSGTARALLPSTPHNFGVPGQWDGVISYQGGLYILEAKAYHRPLSAIPGIDKRLADAARTGLSGVVVVSLSGYAELFAPVPSNVSLIHFAFSDLAPTLNSGQWVMPTGDILKAGKHGLSLRQGQINCATLNVKGIRGKIAFIHDADYLALRRCSLYSSAGKNVMLHSVPPFAKPTNEVERLWDIEDRIRGFYAPPLSQLCSIVAGDGAVSLHGLPSRLKKNLQKVLSNNNELPFPVDRCCARARIADYAPFVFWSQLRSNNTFSRAVELAAEIYRSYSPYAINPYNPNKSRACERYLDAAKV